MNTFILIMLAFLSAVSLFLTIKFYKLRDLVVKNDNETVDALDFLSETIDTWLHRQIALSQHFGLVYEDGKFVRKVKDPEVLFKWVLDDYNMRKARDIANSITPSNAPRSQIFDRSEVESLLKYLRTYGRVHLFSDKDNTPIGEIISGSELIDMYLESLKNKSK